MTSTRLRFRPDSDFDFDFDFDFDSLLLLELLLFERSLGDPGPRSPRSAPAPHLSLLSAAIRRSVSSFTAALARSRASFFSSSRFSASSSVDVSVLGGVERRQLELKGVIGSGIESEG